jgi:hypothetical protein
MNKNGKEICPECNIPMMEKLPRDKKQIKKVIRYFCKCGFYKDLPIKN